MGTGSGEAAQLGQLRLPVQFTPEADRELAEAVTYYRSISSALSDRFLSELDQAIDRICAHPVRYPPISDVARKISVENFPYIIVFGFVTDGVVVYACFHTSRDPAIWQSRL
jgi:plasmid stabilization system protein ParE